MTKWLGNIVSLIENNIWLPAVAAVSQLPSKMPLFIFYPFIHLINTNWVPDMCHSSVIFAQVEKRLCHHSKQILGVDLLTEMEEFILFGRIINVCRKTEWSAPATTSNLKQPCQPEKRKLYSSLDACLWVELCYPKVGQLSIISKVLFCVWSRCSLGMPGGVIFEE